MIKCFKYVLILLICIFFQSCDVPEGKCIEPIGHNYYWLVGQDREITWSQDGTIERLIFFSQADFYDICPSKDVVLYAKVIGRDGHFAPAPYFVRVTWRSEMGWYTVRDYSDLPKKGDNIWEDEINLGSFSYNFKSNSPANIHVQVEIGFNLSWDMEVAIAWLEDEFTRISMDLNYTKF